MVPGTFLSYCNKHPSLVLATRMTRLLSYLVTLIFPVFLLLLRASAAGTASDTLSSSHGLVLVMRAVKLPDTDNATVDMGATVEQCRARCLANCSCVAYAATDNRGGGDGSGCVMWTNYIVDMRYIDKGQDRLYLRLSKSEFDIVQRKRRGVAKIVLPVTASLLAATAAGMYLVWICKLRVSSTAATETRNMEKKGLIMEMVHLQVFILLLLSSSCQSDDQLTQAKPLSPGGMLISKDGVFALGFFSPTNTNESLYIGIWYHNIPDRTLVWVANRDSPITNTTPSAAKLAITDNQELALLDSTTGRPLWTTATGGVGVIAVLLSSGNFVLRSANGTTMWQSFDHPTDTILPTMRVLFSYQGHAVTSRLVASKGPADPSTGDFSLGIDPSSNLQIFVWHGTRLYYSINFFNDEAAFSGSGSYGTSVIMSVLRVNGDELYFVYTVSGDSLAYTRLSLDYTGKIRLLTWNNNTLSWTASYELPSSGCDLYAACGPFGYCDNTESVPSCRCLDGFEPIDGHDVSRGCRRKEALVCGMEDRFVPLSGMKTPQGFMHVDNTSFDQCVAECNTNCSCTAYSYVSMSTAGTLAYTSRCLVWTGDLVDTGKLPSFGQQLYVRLATVSHVQKKSNLVKILLPVIAFVLLIAFTALVLTYKYRGTQPRRKSRRDMLEYLRSMDEAGGKNIEFPFIDFEDIVVATDNFSDTNILGKGGFGKVYKGVLEGTTEVAIKRLSRSSGQGTKEFRNEVVLIAKLQHKNLVRLLGCCIRKDEKLLVYEYMPNKSLDYFIFDTARKSMLQWPARFKIIKGIARGIMYLHQDSRLTIIHRDLKASNILLDTEMTPKISDFGMARIFSGDQHEANTNRVVGTYGYMSPEYAMEGAFSVKSDTYSFGVLLLEIVSGIKISSPNLLMDFPNLIVHAWNLWKDGKIEDLVDSSIKESCPLDEISRCIHIGLLCVQDSPNCRPLMSAVVFMLENKTTPLQIPMQPVYFACRNAVPRRADNNRVSSVNNMSLTALEGR